MKSRNWFALSLLVIAGLLLASCVPAVAPTPTLKPPAKPPVAETPKPAAPTPTPKPAVEQPRYGGILLMSHNGDPPSYDPIQELSIQAATLVIPCYSGVVQHDPLEPTKVIGDLAEKWDMNPDGMSYTFHLYKNVKWHDGTPFTSEDARFSLEVVRNPPKGVISPRAEWLKAVDKIEVPDKDTLKITLQYPSASFLHNLADGRIVAIPKHVFEAKGNMKKDIVGTGPYKFTSHNAGSSFSVVKNPDYFIKGRPYLDGITWYIIPDVAARLAALRTHRVHLSGFGTPGLTATQAEIVRKELSDKVVVDRASTLVTLAFWMPVNKAPWSDIRVRRAVELTIDRPKVLKVAMEGGGEVGSFMIPGAWGLPEAELLKMPGYRQPKDTDIAEARKLMAEAGYSQGVKTTLVTRNLVPMEKAAISIKDQLTQIGVEMTVGIKDAATIFDLTSRRAFDSTVISISVSYDDPDQVFGPAFLTGAVRNYSDFTDGKIDKWYDEQSRIMDPAKRKEIVLNIQRRLHELVPCSILYWASYDQAHWKEVRNFKPGIGVFNNLKFQDVWLTK